MKLLQLDLLLCLFTFCIQRPRRTAFYGETNRDDMTTRRFLTTAIWTLMWVGYSAAMAVDPGKTLLEGLQANSPSVPQDEERYEALKALDAWLSVADSETTEAVVAYYQRAVDHLGAVHVDCSLLQGLAEYVISRST